MSTMDTSDAALLSALLTVEHGVIYGYGVAGAVAAEGAPELPWQTGVTGPVTGPPPGRAATAVSLAIDGLNTHRARRDTLAARIRALNAVPPEPRAAYRLPVQATDPTSALRLIAALEDGLAAACRTVLVEASGASVRDFAAGTIADAAVRGLRARLAAGDPPAAALPALPGT